MGNEKKSGASTCRDGKADAKNTHNNPDKSHWVWTYVCMKLSTFQVVAR